MRARAASSACAVTFGVVLTEALESDTVLKTFWPARSCGRRLNSSGQHCLIEGSALTQETCSRPNSFALAIKVTGRVLAVMPGAEYVTLMTVSSGGRA